MPEAKRLLIVSHVTHFLYHGTYHAYGPYAREIEVWAHLFPEVVIVAPCRSCPPPVETFPISAPNVKVQSVREVGGRTLRKKLEAVAGLPSLVAGLVRGMRWADGIHVRCPGNLGLLGVLLAPIFRKPLIAKYAGSWNPYSGEPDTYRLQRWILRSRWWRGPVTAYVPDEGAKGNLVPFFTSVMTDEQLRRAGFSAANPRPSLQGTLRILYVGRLSEKKNVSTVIRAITVLSKDARVSLAIVGEGEERRALEELASELGVKEAVTFWGGQSYEQVLEQYEHSDVLVLASESEGWPKAVTEAMAFGLICVASDRGMLKEILGGGRGILIPAGDVASLARALVEVDGGRVSFHDMSRKAANWAQHHSLEGLEEALGKLLKDRWGEHAPAD